MVQTEIIALAAIIVYIFLVHFLRQHLVPVVVCSLLVIAAVSVATGREDLAEQYGICAFYFLAAVVLLLFINLIRAHKGEE